MKGRQTERGWWKEGVSVRRGSASLKKRSQNKEAAELRGKVPFHRTVISEQ